MKGTNNISYQKQAGNVYAKKKKKKLLSDLGKEKVLESDKIMI